jgi:hypothetical protein
MDSLEEVLDTYKPGKGDKSMFDSIISSTKLTTEDKEYIKKRDHMNKELKKGANKVLSFVRSLFPEFKTIEFMSSFTARTNLAEAKDMDVDIGVFIPRMTDAKLQKAFETIESHKFKCSRNIVANQYYSCEFVIDGIEYEVKFRPANKTSFAVLELHERMDSLPKQTQDKITIIKKKLKAMPTKKHYQIFKTLVYNSQFAGIPGGFIIQITPT